MRAEWVSVASLVIALGSLLYSRRSARTGRRSLDVASVIGQVNYENARAGHTPAATLVLTEVEHRPATARDQGGIVGAEARTWAEQHEADSLEVVARGQLTNNTGHELLVTLRDHPRSRRQGRYSFRNQSVFILDCAEVDLGRTVLPAGADVTFEWIDRRTRQEWTVIHGLGDACDGTSSPFAVGLSWRDYLKAPFDSYAAERVRQRTIARSGFYIVCESRATERVATIWHAEVVQAPIAISGHNPDTGRVTYGPAARSVTGPIDDDIIRYRVTADPALALLRPPRLRYLRGRD
ncbi:hypothetical protein [Amycolatopsis sp. NPDC004378]